MQKRSSVPSNAKPKIFVTIYHLNKYEKILQRKSRKNSARSRITVSLTPKELPRSGGRIIPVGTTALRLLETAARRSGQIEAWTGETDIFIFPGFQFNVASALMTNFHLPKSTLLMLVSALIGLEQMKSIYSHAIKQKYRFFSYGDSSLLVPQR